MIKFRELLKIYFKKSPVTISLITINTLMFLVTIFTGGFTIINLVDLGGLVPAYISERDEYYRLILPMFLHGGFFHFFMNSYFLFYIGSFVEKILGSHKYLFIYLLSGIGSNVLIWLLGDPLTVTIGASGALFGIMGLLLVLTYTKPEWFPYHTVRNIRSLTIINLVFTFLIPNISIYGHLGGFITGIIFAFILNPKYPQQQKQKENTYYRNYQNQDNIFDYKDVVDDDDLFKS
jgi:rhomboid protease GluP